MKTITVWLILVIGQYSGTYQYEMQKFKEATALIHNQTGINYKVQSITKVRDSKAKRIFKDDPFYTKFYQWATYIERRRPKRAMIDLAIVPLVKSESNFYYYCGFADTCGIKVKGYSRAMAAIAPMNQFMADRTTHSVVAIAHEMAHASGAEHDKKLPASLMNPNALAYVDAGQADFLRLQAKKEITQCLRDYKKGWWK